MEKACAQIISCQRLHAVLRVVLTVGNTLNYGTPRGSADGLRLDSLQKLADMKVTSLISPFPTPHSPSFSSSRLKPT